MRGTTPEVVDERLGVALMCREMKWTYDQYLSQPDWLLETFDVVGSVESQRQKEVSENT